MCLHVPQCTVVTTDAALRRQFILATVREAVRVREMVLNATGLYKPVIVQAWSIVFGTISPECSRHCGQPAKTGKPPNPPCPSGCHVLFHDFLPASSVEDMMTVPYEAGADGVLLWGHPDGKPDPRSSSGPVYFCVSVRRF
jgi:hypothetical protein